MVKNSKGKTNSNKIVWINIFWITWVVAQLNKPPLRRLIYETINSEDYGEKFIKGKIF